MLAADDDLVDLAVGQSEITVDDADAVGQAMLDAGASVVIPIADRFYGRREGRLQDPAGHLWIISQHLEDLSDEEITRRLEAG